MMFIRGIYPALFREPNYEVVYISEMLEDMIEQGKIRVKESGKKVIFTDPCPGLETRHRVRVPSECPGLRG